MGDSLSNCKLLAIYNKISHLSRICIYILDKN